jgi:predicted ArsR family transcriptional regulator
VPYTAQGVGFKATDTSHEAAEEAQGRAPFWRLMVLQDLSLHGPSTADEIAARLQASILTIRPRVSELRNLHKIHDTGNRRANGNGKRTAVWDITKEETANV